MVDNPTSTDRDRNLPRIWKLPPEPPPDVTQVWTVQGVRADRCTAHADCWLLEPGTVLSHYRWPLLLTFAGPLSTTPPEDQPGVDL